MNLRQRILVSLGLTLVGSVFAIYFLSHNFLLDSYSKLEVRATTENVHRASNALGQEVAKVHGLSPDWSNWDDTYKFMGDHNQAYIQANLSVVSIEVDLQLFLDLKGRVFCSKGVTREDGTKPPDPEAVRKALGFDKDPINWPVRDEGVSGFVNLPQGALIVSVRPIKDTAGTAKARGYLVFGRWLNDELTSSVSETTHLRVRLFHPNDVEADANLRPALAAAGVAETPFVTLFDDKHIAGYTVVRDLSGRMLRVLRVVDPRDIYVQGSNSVDFFVGLVLVGAITVAGVVLWVMEAFVLRRLMSLSKQVECVGEDCTRVQEIDLTGEDELSKLSERINEMLIRIRDSQELLELNNDSLRRAVDELATTNVALENAVEGIARLDAGGKFVTVNQAFAKAFGTRPEHLVGHRAADFLSRAAQDSFKDAIDTMARMGRAEQEFEGRRQDGSLFFSENVFLPFLGESGVQDGHYWFLKDISDRKMLEVQIQHQAFHDALTGLPNRVLFLDRLANRLSRRRRHEEALAVIFIDLDNFKVINDSLGHEAGDRLLIGVSQVLQSCVRPEDTVARLGGDEFTILLSDLTCIEDAVAIATRVIEALAEPLAISSGETFASASLGIRYSDSVQDSPEIILRDADTAMYQAKGAGKSNYAIFEPSMNVQAVERMELEAGMRRAVQRGELSLAYQPIVELSSGLVTGMEALLRWKHPELGLIPPDLFIPIAEETGVIVEVGQWALERACRQAKAWNEKHDCQLTVSVNISGRQIQTPDFVERIVETFESAGLDPTLLKLEVTETVIMNDLGGAVAKLAALKSRGVKVAIDNFGIGYSSMASLSTFPIDTVKIDRNFVAKLSDSDVSEAVVKAIITLSQTMNFEVTAEGIERWEQLEQLKRLGCSTAQGYMFFAPMQESEFADELVTGLLYRRFKVTSAA